MHAPEAGSPREHGPAARHCDLLVIGGGINGAGIARDAAGRGLDVVLCEQDDLAGHTSSSSSKLIHGGLRYLEYYEFRLVAKSLAEREVLLRAAPHIIWPLRFVMPHVRTLRPAWLIRLGLFLYDHLDFGKRRLLPGSRGIRLREHPAGAPLVRELVRGFEYSDAWVDDARLVVLNARDAAERGAEVLTRTRCEGARRDADGWLVRLRSSRDGRERTVAARGLVNAAGPWVGSLLASGLGINRPYAIRQVQGSHIVVPALFDHGYGYIFQNPDRRIVFALPYEEHFTLVGTTELEYRGDPGEVAISDDEVRYLCDTVNRYFTSGIVPGDVVHTFSGVRPLMDDESGDASSVTRDYLLDFDQNGPPVLSVFGGKITTFRKLAEEAVDRIAPTLGCDAGHWTETVPLPGGDLDAPDFDAFVARLQAARSWLGAALARRYARAYGSRVERLLGEAGSLEALGPHLGDGLYAAEVRYLVEQEWATTADDVLWRRSKLGLRVTAETRRRLDDFLAMTLEPVADSAPAALEGR